MKDDIKQIEKRINSLKKPKAKESSKLYKNSSLGFRIITELLSGVVIGGAIGYFLDDLLNTKPMLLIIFLLFGAGAGILNVYRLAKKEGENRG